jgi:hypothetical protein
MVVSLKDGKWHCSACGKPLGTGVAIPTESRTSTDEKAFIVISNDDGDEIHRCEVRQQS